MCREKIGSLAFARPRSDTHPHARDAPTYETKKARAPVKGPGQISRRSGRWPAEYLGKGIPRLLASGKARARRDGLDVLANIRRHPALPIVMLTVVSDADYVAKELALGADGYVTKPYSKNILVGVIKGVLDNR